MAADGRFGGHMVSGHIDGTGVISQMKQEGNAVWVTVDTSEDLMRLIGGERLHRHRWDQPYGSKRDAGGVSGVDHPPHRGGDHASEKENGGGGKPGE